MMILSCMLVLALALPAAAQGGNFFTSDGNTKESNIYVAPGTSKEVTFGITGVSANEFKYPLYLDYPISSGDTLKLDDVQAFDGGASTDISISTSPGHHSFSVLDFSAMKLDTDGSHYFVDTGGKLIISNSGAQGASYLVTMTVTGHDSLGPRSRKITLTVNQNITGVPEFPTVALPVAGIIGLLFVFGRKKVDM